MINLILFDDEVRNHLLPLTFTRPVSMLRIGILTICEKWEKVTGSKASFITQSYLKYKYPLQITDDNMLVNGSTLPTDALVSALSKLNVGEIITCEGNLLGARLTSEQVQALLTDKKTKDFKTYDLPAEEICKINKPWDIFLNNGQSIADDFHILTKGRKSQVLNSSNRVLGSEQHIFIEEGATVQMSILNAETGPIYIGKDALIMEGSMVRGPFAMCEHTVLKMGAKIYGPTTLGPYSKVGGEVNNSLVQGYSNKGHEGFLGNSVLGEWCNLGADTNTSNLKNNYAPVKLWSYEEERFVNTGQQFCGLIMGDHAKCGINTMFNTGTVVGVSANVFGDGFPRNFIPSFTWGGAKGFSAYRFDKAVEVANVMMKRRNLTLTDEDRNILEEVMQLTAKYRRGFS